MKSGKPRIYLALYARLKHPDTYHYAIHISPKTESNETNELTTTKYHCKNIIQAVNGIISTPWTYEAVPISPLTDSRILARIVIGKVRRPQAIEEELSDVPVVQGDPDYNCVKWVRLALIRLKEKNIITSRPVVEWDVMQRAALEYIAMKKQEGRYDLGWKGDASRVATYDYCSQVEIVP